MNNREKDYFKLLRDMGKALAHEARKTNIDQDVDHSITFCPESGYVHVSMKMGGIEHHATIYDQFPDVDYQTYDARTNTWTKERL